MKLIIFTTCILLIFNCSNKSLDSNSKLKAEEFEVKDSVRVKVLPFRAKVLKQSNGKYSLLFNKEDTEMIQFYKPRILKLSLPFINERELLVLPKYSQNEVITEFIYKSGWIDSSELRGVFDVKELDAWLVPIQSIYSPFGKIHYIIKNNNQKAELYKVSILSLNDSSVLIIGNLKYGDKILKTRLGEAVQDSILGAEL
jgi:hypothetical protein